MQPLPQVQIRSQLVRFVIIYRQGLLGQLLLHLLLVFHHRFVIGGVGDPFGEYVLIDVELLFDILVLVRLPQIGQKIAVHQSLVLSSNFLRCNSKNTVSIVSHPDQQRTQQDTHVKTVPLLPSGHIGRTRDTFGKFIRRVQFLILHKSAQPLCTLLVVVELEESQFGRPDGGAYKFVNIALILGIEEELPLLIKVLVILLFELNDMFKDKFLLGCVLLVGHPWSLLLLKVLAALKLLVVDHLAALQKLNELIVHLALHLKYITFISIIQKTKYHHTSAAGLYRKKHSCFSLSTDKCFIISSMVPP